MDIQNKRIPEAEFNAIRAEVLTQWPTGKDVNIEEAVAYHKSIPDNRNFGKKLIQAKNEGRTLIHDWVFENRAIYSTELTKLGARVELLDAHRIYVEGPTRWRATELVAPPALRPAVVVMIAMLAAPGTSILRNIYSINRGYQDFATRLNRLGARIAPLAGL